MLEGKCVLLGVTGSIAAYKAAALASALVKQKADVHILMTQNATQFISPITFETLTNHKVPLDTFDRNFEFQVEHVSLGKKADLVIVAPATANIIAKLAYGIADDMLSTTILACQCPLLIAPAMNTRMYENPVTQDNLERLKKYGWHVITPAAGRLACGDTGTGKMPEPEILLEEALFWACKKDLSGLRILVTAGPTQEALDPVRYLTNHSSGKMGYAIAQAAARRGAEVTLISGPTALKVPAHVKQIPVTSAEDMFQAVASQFENQDIIIKAAAVADYRPAQTSDQKIKKKDGDSRLELCRTKDILGWLGEHRKSGQFLCGFSMETENLIENSRAKLARKRVDMIAANHLFTPGAGFQTDTNVLTLITQSEEIPLPQMSKEKAANCLLDEILKRYQQP